MDATHLLAAAVTPVALVSACGLVTLALYNRLGATLARVRAFHQHKLTLLVTRRDADMEERQALLSLLDSQVTAVTGKARAIRNGLYCLLGATSAFLVCGVFAGATVHCEWCGPIAIGTGGLGVALFLGGLGWAARELTLSLTPLEEESVYLTALAAHRATPHSADRLMAVGVN